MYEHADRAEEQASRARRDESLQAPELGNRPPRGAGAPMTAASLLHLQRSVGNAGTAAMLAGQEDEHAGHDHSSPVHQAIGSGGSPLDKDTRSTMESHFGEDFSSVRLHVDAGSAESVKAAAYTVGNDIVVHPSHYSAGTPSAQRTLAHELTHVVQQRSGPVAGESAPGGIRVSDPSDRFEQEAEQRATDFASASHTTAPVAGAQAGQNVQRKAVAEEEQSGTEDEEAPVQGISLDVQRTAVAEEEQSGSEDEEAPVQGISLDVQRTAVAEEEQSGSEDEEAPVQGLSLDVQRESESEEEEGHEGHGH